MFMSKLERLCKEETFNTQQNLGILLAVKNLVENLKSIITNRLLVILNCIHYIHKCELQIMNVCQLCFISCTSQKGLFASTKFISL